MYKVSLCTPSDTLVLQCEGRQHKTKTTIITTLHEEGKHKDRSERSQSHNELHGQVGKYHYWYSRYNVYSPYIWRGSSLDKGTTWSLFSQSVFFFLFSFSLSHPFQTEATNTEEMHRNILKVKWHALISPFISTVYAGGFCHCFTMGTNRFIFYFIFVCGNPQIGIPH